MTRRNRRRTRAHLLRELKRVLSNPGIRTFRHSLADRMIAQTRARHKAIVQTARDAVEQGIYDVFVPGEE